MRPPGVVYAATDSPRSAPRNDTIDMMTSCPDRIVHVLYQLGRRQVNPMMTHRDAKCERIDVHVNAVSKDALQIAVFTGVEIASPMRKMCSMHSARPPS
jgi:hypothetical protein